MIFREIRTTNWRPALCVEKRGAAMTLRPVPVCSVCGWDHGIIRSWKLQNTATKPEKHHLGWPEWKRLKNWLTDLADMIFKNDLHTWFPWPTSCSKGAVRAFMLSNTQVSESLCRLVAPWKLDHWPKTEIWQWVNMANMANGQIFVSIASYRDNQCQYTLQDRGKVDCHISNTSTLLEELGNVTACRQLLLWFQDLQRTKTLTTNSPLKDLGILFLHIFTLYFWDFDRFPDVSGVPRVPWVHWVHWVNRTCSARPSILTESSREFASRWGSTPGRT